MEISDLHTIYFTFNHDSYCPFVAQWGPWPRCLSRSKPAALRLGPGDHDVSIYWQLSHQSGYTYDDIYKYNLTICKHILYIGFLHHPYTCISMAFFEYIHIFICIHVALNLPSPFSSLNNTMSRRFQTQDYDMISYSKILVKAATFWHIPDLHPYLPRLPRSTPHAS